MLCLVQIAEDAATRTWVLCVFYRKHTPLNNFSEIIEINFTYALHFFFYLFHLKELVFTFKYASP
jgi:hypothetical protein